MITLLGVLIGLFGASEILGISSFTAWDFKVYIGCMVLGIALCSCWRNNSH